MDLASTDGQPLVTGSSGDMASWEGSDPGPLAQMMPSEIRVGTWVDPVVDARSHPADSPSVEICSVKIFLVTGPGSVEYPKEPIVKPTASARVMCGETSPFCGRAPQIG